MTKKYLYFALLPLLLTSCNSSNTSQSTHDDEDNSGVIKEDVTIDFLCMADSKYLSKLKDMIKEFMEKEPHVKVNLSNPLGTGNYGMLEKSVVAGFFKDEYPDIVQGYPDNVVKYINRHYAVKLDDYLSNEEYGIIQDKQDYIPSFIEEGASYHVNGTYSLPFCKSTEVLFYNEDALLGLDLSDIDASINNGKPIDAAYLDDLSWETLFGNLCPAIKAYNNALPIEEKIIKGDNPTIFTYDSDENFFITLANQYNYGYTSVNEEGQASIDFNNDGMKNLMKKMNAARNNGYIETKATYGDYTSSLFTSESTLFTVASTAGLTYLYDENNPFKIGVAKIPHPEGKPSIAINQGPSVCILDHHDENRALASFLLWKHITDEKNSSSWAVTTGYMGIRNSSYTSQEYLDAFNVDENETDLYKIASAKLLGKIADVRDTTFNTRVFKGSSNARTNAGLLLRDCLLSNDIDTDIDQLFQSYAEEAKTHL